MENVTLPPVSAGPGQPTYCALYYRELHARRRALKNGNPVEPEHKPEPASDGPTNCALYWREYNARKCIEDPTWEERRRKAAALRKRR